MQRQLLRPVANGSSDGSQETRLGARSGARVQMTAALRVTLLTACALLWVSGALWLVLHFGFAQQSPFGPLPNPWEPAVMRVHGLAAVGGVFLLGWMAGGHVLERWGSLRNRLSGLLLAACAALLAASGYALYYATGALHDAAVAVHELLGVASIGIALAHWWRIRPAH